MMFRLLIRIRSLQQNSKTDTFRVTSYGEKGPIEITVSLSLSLSLSLSFFSYMPLINDTLYRWLKYQDCWINYNLLKNQKEELKSMERFYTR